MAAGFQSAPGVKGMWVDRSHVVVITYDPKVTDADKLLYTLNNILASEP